MPAWIDFICSWPMQWRELVKSFLTYESITDFSMKGHKSSCSAGTLTCQICGSSSNTFLNDKALQCHMRVRHGHRCQAKSFISADAKCPVCHVSFSSRLRAIAHLSERRKRGKASQTCYDVMLGGSLIPLPTTEVSCLDESDRIARTSAKRLGRSHPIAAFSAKRTRVRAVPDCCAVPIVVSDTSAPKRRRLRCKQSVPAL